MARLIDADALMWHEDTIEDNEIYIQYIPVSAVENAPVIDAIPVVHGRWIVFQPGKDFPHLLPSYYCSVCGKNSAFVVDGMEPIPPQLFNRLIYHYCPHCGAKMDLEEV